MPQQSRKKRILIILAVVAIAAACVGCCVLVLIVSSLAPPGSGTPSLGVDVCAGVVTTPQFQVGVAWYSPLASYRGPLAYSPYAACFHFSVSSMPTRLYREWMFPP